MRTLTLGVPGWPGHLAGQHLDVRLTAEDGYQAEREYSVAAAPGEQVAITVERLDDGEVSPYLTQEFGRRRDRDPRPGGRLLRLAARRRWSAAVDRRGSGSGAAAGDAAGTASGPARCRPGSSTPPAGNRTSSTPQN